MAAELLPLSKRVEKIIAGLDARTQIRVRAKISELAAFPNVSDVGKMEGRKDAWKTRVGPLRIIFVMGRSAEGQLTIEIVDVDDRKHIYKRGRDMPRVRRRDVGASRGRTIAADQVQRLVGENLRAARIHAGLTQVELARRIDRAQTTVSQAEAGRIVVSEAYLDAVLKACRLPRDWGRRYWAPDAS
jgi:mRNA-degrading endonuclease RelE of RelBE toxin-antitoxin system/DNA-binding XRE family transcriptional regulator